MSFETNGEKRTRVLHVLGSLNRGGAETWLIQLMRELSSGIDMDFAVYSEGPFDFSESVAELGGRVFSCGSPRFLPLYLAKLNKIIRENGPYDVVHSHLNEFSGVVLSVAKGCGVPNRIAHSHTQRTNTSGLRMRTWTYPVLRELTALVATDRIGCSEGAAETIFATSLIAGPSQPRVVHCGIDLSHFSHPDPKIRETLRQEFGLKDNAFVVGHVGRFTREKNHSLILDIAELSVRDSKDVVFVLVGRGPLLNEVQQQIEARRLQGSVILAGLRDDVPTLMTSLFDALLFPSLFEGLPIALIEAQAAGLPCVLSDGIASDSHILADLVKVVPLDAPLDCWIGALNSFRRFSRPSDTIGRLSQTDFSIVESARRMHLAYEHSGVWA